MYGAFEFDTKFHVRRIRPEGAGAALVWTIGRVTVASLGTEVYPRSKLAGAIGALVSGATLKRQTL